MKSLADQATHVMRLRADEETARRIADFLFERLDPAETAVAAVEGEGGWLVEAHFSHAPDREKVVALVRAASGGQPTSQISFEHVAAADWVAASLAGLAPVRVGRFVVHGAHDRDKCRPNEIGIEIEAALAFGTGHHGTTQGCLAAINEFAKRRAHRPLAARSPSMVSAVHSSLPLKAGRRPPQAAGWGSPRRQGPPPGSPPLRSGSPTSPLQGEVMVRDRVAFRKKCRGMILDLGAGTGVLAIAAARALRRPVVAGEIDPWAVTAAVINVRRNRAQAFSGSKPGVRVVRADGLKHATIRAGAPYELVLANLLLLPLQRLARPLRALIAPGGVAVLSGLLPRQANAALAAWRAQGFVLRRRRTLDGWTTLTLARARRWR